MAELFKFNSVDMCPKCGNSKASTRAKLRMPFRDVANTRYCKGTNKTLNCFDFGKEHLHRDCLNCGYVWYEKTMEASK